MITFKEWLNTEAMEFSAGFRGASRRNLGDTAHLSQYAGPGESKPETKVKAANIAGDWARIDKEIKNNRCDSAEDMFTRLKQYYLDKGDITTAQNAEKGWHKDHYGLSICPINKLMDKGDCDGAFEKLNAVEDELKRKNKDHDAKLLGQSFWNKWYNSRCNLPQAS